MVNRGLPERLYGRVVALVLVTVFFGAAAAALGYVAVSLGFSEQPSGKAKGRVLEADRTWSRDGHVVVEFTASDGRVVRFRSDHAKWKVRIGQQVNLRYDPRDPVHSVVRAEGQRAVAVVMTSLFSLASGASGVVTVRSIPRYWGSQ
ncbi:DUF3592 domain-containing protein [Actinomadura barringtoniae]|uniref:DUF3592 domain-containing protein n=1 Tax=Actinomadura barringtoniae TaxID=1427535 RepID=A0A939P9P8_9ACTN|nr:DUF3592 domain-containing protein [Actinomadura barringtoniae]MBO2445938.1 DUF3592 domain-containing protein [Actinomadura barringtoniae]